MDPFECSISEENMAQEDILGLIIDDDGDDDNDNDNDDNIIDGEA